jgi:hypothetical protein
MDFSSLKDLSKCLLSTAHDDSKGREPFSDTQKRTVSAPEADTESRKRWSAFPAGLGNKGGNDLFDLLAFALRTGSLGRVMFGNTRN